MSERGRLILEQLTSLIEKAEKENRLWQTFQTLGGNQEFFGEDKLMTVEEMAGATCIIQRITFEFRRT